MPDLDQRSHWENLHQSVRQNRVLEYPVVVVAA